MQTVACKLRHSGLKATDQKELHCSTKHTLNSTRSPSASTSQTPPPPAVPLRGSVAPPSSQTLCANEKPTPACQLINNKEMSVCVCFFCTGQRRLLLMKVLTPRTLNLHLPHVPPLCQGGLNVGGLGLCSLNCHALFLWALTSSGVLLLLTDFSTSLLLNDPLIRSSFHSGCEQQTFPLTFVFPTN